MLPATLVIPFLFPVTYAQLNTLAIAAGLKYFGTATDNSELTDTAYVAALSNTSDFGQLTPGNGQKWEYVEPSNGTFDFTDGDVVPALAKTNSQLLRCHNLVWYSQLPSWVSGGTWTNSTLQAVMKLHITTEMTHYKGQCYAWDVVNEALDDSAAFRTDVFYNAMGEDYIKIAFETAALADPDVKLYYNDYNIGYSGAKATAALALVTKLVNAGVKIDGVGEQGHYIVGSTPTKADQVATLEKYTALGLEVAYTELDIRMTLPSTDAQLAQQSTDYQTVVGACLAVNGCIGITVWDFDDKYSWIPNTFSGKGAACLFDENLNRKPAYFGVVSVLSAAAGTSTSTAAAIVSSTTVAQSAIQTSSATVVSSSKGSHTPSGMTTSYIKASASTIAVSKPVSSASVVTQVSSITAVPVEASSTAVRSVSSSSLIASAVEALASSSTTLTVYATSVYTITSCAASITNCPARASESTSEMVVTDTIVLTTTVCPVAEASSAKSAVLAIYSATPSLFTSAALSTASAAGVVSTSALTTSTTAISSPTGTDIASPTASSTTLVVYATSIYTITSCAASITNCPANAAQSTSELVVTDVIELTTTVCPVAEASSAVSKVLASYSATATAAGVVSSAAPSETSSSIPQASSSADEGEGADDYCESD